MMKDFENNPVHKRDLAYLLKYEPVDMSPEAVTRRMYALDELCHLSLLLKIPHLEEFRRDREPEIGSNN